MTIYSYGVKTATGEWFQGRDMHNEVTFGYDASLACLQELQREYISFLRETYWENMSPTPEQKDF